MCIMCMIQFICVRLGPGEMLSVDLSTGQVFHNNELKPRIARKRPYQQMVEDTVYTLKPAEFKAGKLFFRSKSLLV